MILKRQNLSENKWNHFKIVPKGHNHCQLSIVNCQFGEAAKFQFAKRDIHATHSFVFSAYLLPQQQSQKLAVGQRSGIIGTVQDSVQVLRVVFYLLGPQLRIAYEIPRKASHQQG